MSLFESDHDRGYRDGREGSTLDDIAHGAFPFAPKGYQKGYEEGVRDRANRNTSKKSSSSHRENSSSYTYSGGVPLTREEKIELAKDTGRWYGKHVILGISSILFVRLCLYIISSLTPSSPIWWLAMVVMIPAICYGFYFLFTSFIVFAIVAIIFAILSAIF